MFRLLSLLMIVSVGCSSSSTSPTVPEFMPDMDASDTADAEDVPNVQVSCDPARTAVLGTTEHMVEHGGLTRTFRVHVPPGYTPSNPTPVVLMFHGGGGSGEQFEERSSRMNEVADRENFIAVYPDGTGTIRTWNGGGCCGAAVRNDVDDVGFVAAMLDALEESHCTDSRRIFASGMSNGGIFSHRLACEMSDRIAAIAPVAGTNMMDTCTPARNVPVMQIHGTEDGHVPWEGGEGCGIAGVPFISVPATIDGWRLRNGCSEMSTEWYQEGNGVCDVFEGCSDGADVVLCGIEGGGHSWPGGVVQEGILECPEDGPQSTTFEASEVIWRFFKTQSLQGEN